jgi:hypothetical protein
MSRVTDAHGIQKPSAPFDLRLDTSPGGGISYIGEAVAGSATSAAVWRLKRLDEATGADIRYANSDTGFVHVYDDRASQSYP